MRNLIILFTAASLLAGCASVRDSRFNPRNWVDSTPDVVTSDSGAIVLPTLAPRKGYVAFVDTRPLIAQMTGLSLQRTQTGAILVASGRVPTQGYYDAELVEIDEGLPNRLTYAFRIRPPSTAMPATSAAQSALNVAVTLSNAQLLQATEIVVQAGNVTRSLRP
ncbi:hypothetical protein AQS8620_01914 [Aquimixticola soesokkakensis]|uniref:Lipoprotein n=1 Tax=Aquimixticola soesokkakensis TaxID=1519096 RepID=A0A1Y5STU0_9RHOB|nr:hypothetical protein [Aquimixticola soesokkakensis]SLN46350.1 hypothetical protein AQS8620_01914 [Aquimixticola soesokkakensis]